MRSGFLQVDRKFCSLTTLALACAVVVLSPAFTLPLHASPAPQLRACIVPTPELTPIFRTAPVNADDDDDDDDDEEFNEDAIRGWLASDGVTCIAFGGSIAAGINAEALTMPRGRPASLRSQDVIAFPVIGTAKLDAVANINGWTAATGLTLTTRPGSDLAIDRAVVSIGPLKAGRDVSTFVFFDGADFAFSARMPARLATMFAYTMQLTDNFSMTASVENPPDATSTLATGARWPDLISRARYVGNGATLHASGALRELRRADGGPTRLASAFLLGASRDVVVGDVTHTLLAQGGGTLGGPIFIGSQLDSTDVLTLLSGGEVTNGWSALASLTSAWTRTVSTSAYVSHFALRVPDRTAAAGRMDISRAAMNVVWKPARMVKVGLEVGWSRSDVTWPRVSSNGVSTRRTTAFFWLQKSF